MISRSFVSACACAGAIAVLVAGCSTLFSGKHAQGTLAVGDTMLAERWTRDGMRYLIWPADDAPPASGELWIVLHDGAAAPGQLPLPDLCRVARANGATLLLPQGSLPFSSSFAWQPARDARSIIAAVRDLRATRNVNTAQIGLFGVGDGCAVAWQMIADQPEMFWCAGMVFGALPDDERLLQRLPAHLARLPLFCAIDDTEDSTNLVTWLAMQHIEARVSRASAGLYSFTPALKEALFAFMDDERARTCPVTLVAPPHGTRVPVGTAGCRLEAALCPARLL